MEKQKLTALEFDVAVAKVARMARRTGKACAAWETAYALPAHSPTERELREYAMYDAAHANGLV